MRITIIFENYEYSMRNSKLFSDFKKPPIFILGEGYGLIPILGFKMDIYSSSIVMPCMIYAVKE
jgi:hypothetical protein